MLSDALFVSDRVHQRDVKLPDGSVHTLHFRELPAVEFRKFQLADQSDDDDKRAGGMAKLVAASLCEEDGKPALDYKRARMLSPTAMNAILEALLDVNGFGGDAGKPLASEAANGSGTSSPSPSDGP